MDEYVEGVTPRLNPEILNVRNVIMKEYDEYYCHYVWLDHIYLNRRFWKCLSPNKLWSENVMKMLDHAFVFGSAEFFVHIFEKTGYHSIKCIRRMCGLLYEFTFTIQKSRGDYYVEGFEAHDLAMYGACMSTIEDIGFQLNSDGEYWEYTLETSE